MKTLITYSSKTNQTEKVAKKLKEYIPHADFLPMNEVKDIDQYDYFYIGGWIDKGTYNKEAHDFVSNMQNKKASFFFTLGAYPNSMHAYDCIENIKKLFKENNNEVVTHWHCQGAVAPKLIEWMNTLDPKHGHGMDASRKLRLEDAKSHPNQEDFNSLFNFAEFTRKKLEQ